MKTFKCTLLAASYGHARYGTYTRPFEMIVEENDPRLPTLRASHSWKIEEVGFRRPGGGLPPSEPKAKTKVADLSALENKDAALLAAEGITTIDEVIEQGEEGLQHIHGIGEATAKRIMVAANKAVNAAANAQARADEKAAQAESEAEDEND